MSCELWSHLTPCGSCDACSVCVYLVYIYIYFFFVESNNDPLVFGSLLGSWKGENAKWVLVGYIYMCYPGNVLR